MRIMMRLKDSSIFKKIMAAFMAALLPLMAITWFINDKGADSIKTERSQAILGMGRYYLDSLNKEADQIIRYLPNYVTDSDLMEIAAMGDEMSYYERAQKILDIQKRLNLMKDSSTVIKEAKAYVPLLDRTLLSGNYETSIDRQEYEAIQPSNRGYNEPFIYWQDRIFLSMQYPANSLQEPIFVIGVELSPHKIKESMSEVSNSFGGSNMLINIDRGWHIQSHEDPDLVKSVTNFIMEKKEAGEKEGYATIGSGDDRYLAVYNYSELWNSYSVSCIPEESLLGPIQKYRVWFWWACVLAIFVVIFFSYFLFRLIYRPLLKLVSSFRRVQQNRFEPITIDRGQDEFGYLYLAFNNTIRYLKTLIEENYEQQIRNQRSELKRLQSQINPHFLYNCFFVLCRLIKSENKDKAYQFCLYIGEYFHFITRNDEDEIPLSLEVKHSRTYVDMQTVCYGDRIHVTFIGESPEIMVPRLVLQPIIENAYKHVFGNMLTNGELLIYCEQNDEEVVFYVEDNGQGITDEVIDNLNMRLKRSAEDRMEETTGLVNVHRRIQLRYGADYGITIERSALGGLKVGIHMNST